MILELGNLYTTVHGASPEEKEAIKEECRYRMHNWEFAKRKTIEKAKRANDQRKLEWARKWDGYQSLQPQPYKFPTGLVNKVANRLILEGADIKIDDMRYRPKPVDGPLSLKRFVEKRDYQVDAVKTALKKGRGIIKAPTGSGKTVIGAMLFAQLHVPTLIVVNKLVLIDQWKETLQDFVSLPKGYIGEVHGSEFNPSFVTIASTQTLLSKLKQSAHTFQKEILDIHPRGWGMFIKDECHGLGADGEYQVAMNCPSYYRFGFSATPLSRKDANLRVIAALGPLLCDVSHEELIEKGKLAEPEIKFVPVGRKYFDKWMDYQKVYRKGIVYNEERNDKITDIAVEEALKGKKVLVFVDLIDHGTILEADLIDKEVTHVDDEPGAEGVFVHGQHKKRETLINAFKDDNSYVDILVATEGLIGEGFDYKGIDVVIVADGGKSSIQTIQKIGRGMRVKDEKNKVKIYDFADRCKYLADHSRRRYDIWSRLGYDIDISETHYLV